jgi:osmotically-inducible protein OsmY
MARRLTSLLAAALGLFAAGCAVVQPGRSVGRELDDQSASIAIKSSMLRAEGYDLGGIDVEVTEGVALLSGAAPRLEDKIHAECLAWSAPSVRRVESEVEVGGGRGIGRTARDALLTQQVRGRLLADASVRSVNYNIEVRDGVVYLLGYARSAAERERAASHASLVAGVQRVVVLVRAEGETPAFADRGARQATLCDSPSVRDGARPDAEPEGAVEPALAGGGR